MRLRIRDMREDKDLTQQAVADMLNCDRSLYSRYERQEREVPLWVVNKLAEYYGTSVDYLIGRTDERSPYLPAKYK